MRPTLRIVISLLIGTSVVLVAATVVAIASSLYIQAASRLGHTYATQLADSGADEAGTFLQTQLDFIVNSQISVAMIPNLKLSKDDANFDLLSICIIMKNVFRFSNFTMQTFTHIWDDGAATTIQLFRLWNNTLVFRCSLLSAFGVIPGARGARSFDLSFDVETNHQYNDTALFNDTPAYSNFLIDPLDLGNAYVKYVSRLDDSTPWWGYPIAFKADADAAPKLLFPITLSQLNSTGVYVGFIYASIAIDYLSEFLRSLSFNSPNSHAFAINWDNWILGSSHPNPIWTVTQQPSSLPYDTTNCASSDSVDSYPIAGIICRVLPKNFGFAPLTALVARNETIFKSPTAFRLEMEVNGNEYAISGHRLNVGGRVFAMSMIFFIDFDEIVHDVEQATMIVIGVGAGILAVGVVAAVICLMLVLRPLEAIARKMNATSRLHMSAADGDDCNDAYKNNASLIREVFALQAAYAQMHSAFDAFTKYVPRDIVKNLIHHGHLAKVGVSPTYATLLFSDIQGFTSLCERQDPSELANALQVFFEQMSSIVAFHEGVIIQYVGDAVVAAWGSLSSMCEFQELKASLTALMMSRETRLPALARAFDSMGERVCVRIGVNSGMVLSGTIGATSRIAYSVLGPASDFASSLEATNKEYGTKIIVGAAVAEQVRRYFCLRSLGFFDSTLNGGANAYGADAGAAERKHQGLREKNEEIQQPIEQPRQIVGLGSTSSSIKMINDHSNDAAAFPPSSHNMLVDFTVQQIFELVGCLPLAATELEELRETKRRTANGNGGSQASDASRASQASSSDIGSDTDGKTDVASTFSSALKKKTKNVDCENNNNNNRRMRKIRLTARALFETASRCSEESLVVSEPETEFCAEFNELVDRFNGVKSCGTPSSSSKKILTVVTTGGGGGGVVGSGGGTGDAKLDDSGRTEGRPAGVYRLDSGISSSDDESSSQFFSPKEVSAGNGVPAARSPTNNKNSQRQQSSAQPNRDKVTKGEALQILLDLKSRFPVFFQLDEAAARKFSRERRCSASYLYCYKAIAKIFGQDVRDAVFAEENEQET